jgi:hypothetical protein
MLHARSVYSCMSSLSRDLDTMSSVGESLSRSLIVTRHVVRLDLLDAGLRVVGVMVIMG